MKSITATTLVNIFNGTTNVATLLGAFLCDTYFGRYKTLGFASVASFMVPLLSTIFHTKFKHSFSLTWACVHVAVRNWCQTQFLQMDPRFLVIWHLASLIQQQQFLGAVIHPQQTCPLHVFYVTFLIYMFFFFFLLMLFLFSSTFWFLSTWQVH